MTSFFYCSGLFIMCLVAVMSAIVYEAFRLVYMFFHLRAHQNPILYGHKVTKPSGVHRTNSESLQSLISNLSITNIKKRRQVSSNIVHFFCFYFNIGFFFFFRQVDEKFSAQFLVLSRMQQSLLCLIHIHCKSPFTPTPLDIYILYLDLILESHIIQCNSLPKI